MHVNSQWDLEYRETDEAFRQYRRDSQQAQEENQNLIEKIKVEKDKMSKDIRDLSLAISRKDKEIGDLRLKCKSLQDLMAAAGSNGKLGRGNQGRIRDLEEESQFLRQQVSVHNLSWLGSPL